MRLASKLTAILLALAFATVMVGCDQQTAIPPDPDAGDPPPPPPPAECGNNRQEDPEVCDGIDLADKDCEALGFAAGAVTCKESCNDFDTEACTPLTPTPIAAAGASIQLTGALNESSPTWARASAGCTESFSDGHPFQAFAIVNNTGAVQALDVAATWAGDGFLHVYSDFRADRPGENCANGNDDGADGTGSSLVEGQAIAPGEVLIVVASTFESGDPIGDFTIDVATVDPNVNPGDCGNNTVEAGETCDGTDFAGQTCGSLGFDRGELSCSGDCQTIIDTGCINDPPPQGNATPIANPGNTITLDGVLDGGDLWDRPNADCSDGTGGADHPVRVHSIVNNTGSAQVVRVTASWGGDGFLFAFNSPSDTGAPQTGCIIGDDDFEGLNGSQIADLQIAAGQTLDILATTFSSNANIGAYTIEVLTQEAAVCGDDVRGFGEVCDGDDLDNSSCIGQGFSGGVLVCESDCGGFETRDCFNFAPTVDIAQPGGDVDLIGSLDATDPTWTRPLASCAEGFGAGRFYDAHLIRNNTGSPQTLTVTATWAGDGFLHAFTRFGFSPVSPTSGCLDGSDDFGGTGGSQLVDLNIAAGETLVLVASTFGTTPIAGYSIEVATDQGAVCGNGIIEGSEQCDGASLAGQTCQTLNRDGGSLACNDSCAFQQQDCFDFGGPVTLAQPGGTVTFQGSIDANDPRYARPFSSCGSTSPADHFFDAVRLRNTTGSELQVDITARWLDSADGFIHAYTTFDSANATAGCIAGDDDFDPDGGGPLVARDGSQLTDITVPAGGEIVVVASTFAGNLAIGGYQVEVLSKGPPATPIAEPGLTIQLSGSVDSNDGVWDLMTASCNDGDGVPNHFFDVHRITNNTGARQDLTITAAWDEGDGFLHLVGDGFDTTNPDPILCITGDDDFNAGVGPATRGSKIISDPDSDTDFVFINPGETLVIIASGFGQNDAVGAYTLDVLTGSETATPPPSAVLPTAGSVSTAGTLHQTDTQWDRRRQDCSPGFGNLNDFDVHFFTASIDDTYRFHVDWDAGDGFLHVFLADDTFDRTDPNVGTDGDGFPCLAGNDDAGSPVTPATSEADVFLFAGETVGVITSTTFSAEHIGDYILTASPAP
jgi:hypothetical protein